MVSRRMWRAGHPFTTTTTRSSLRNNLRRRLICRSRFWLNSITYRRRHSIGHESSEEQPVESSSATFNVGTGTPDAEAEESSSGGINEEQRQIIQQIVEMVAAARAMDPRPVNENVIEEEPVVEFLSKKKAVKRLNHIEQFLEIRKEVDMYRRTLEPPKSVIPAGFKKFLTYRQTYTLGGAHNNDWSLIEPTVHPCTPDHMKPQVKDIIMNQHKERHSLRTRQLAEREKLTLTMEQEILREHSRSVAGTAPPLSFCTIVRDEEVCKPFNERRQPTTIRRGYWLQSELEALYKKWDQVKISMLWRHRDASHCLHELQKMDLERKFKELDPFDRSFSEESKNLYLDIPIVHVPEAF